LRTQTRIALRPTDTARKQISSSKKRTYFKSRYINSKKKVRKVRLFARVHPAGDKVQLLVSNLSEFDLWINQVEVIVTDGGAAPPANRTIGGARRIPRGHAEDEYNLYSGLMFINGNRSQRIDMKFRVKVVATGVEDDPVTVHSPEYHVKLSPGNTPVLDVLKR
jgi:hypothetical protein